MLFIYHDSAHARNALTLDCFDPSIVAIWREKKKGNGENRKTDNNNNNNRVRKRDSWW